jgi:IS30 family transposase
MDEIATQMKRSKSTISRELKRNSIEGTLYLPDTTKQDARTQSAIQTKIHEHQRIKHRGGQTTS